MKMTCLLFSLLLSNSLPAQQENEAIKKTIQTFFEGMGNADTLVMKNTLDSSCFLYSIINKRDGSTIVEEETVAAFFQQVQGLKGHQADEQLLSYDIKTDGAMAIAWTPYKFYFNGQFSHCGVNVFTLVKRKNDWKIMGITDTRRKQGCD